MEVDLVSSPPSPLSGLDTGTGSMMSNSAGAAVRWWRHDGQHRSQGGTVSVSASVAALPDAPDALSFDQRVAVLERLHQLSELEDSSVERVATAGITSLLAYRIGLRDAVRDALARLCDGTYGDCETCRRPIPPARLVAVPYARRCAPCQQREEESWDQVQRLIASVVRTLVGEPQGRSQMTPKLVGAPTPSLSP
jgi:DnaK suppressor protein